MMCKKLNEGARLRAYHKNSEIMSQTIIQGKSNKQISNLNINYN